MRQTRENLTRKLVFAVVAVIHQAPHDFADRHGPCDGLATNAAAPGAIGFPRFDRESFQQLEIGSREAFLVSRGRNIGRKNRKVRHLGADARYVRIFQDSFDLGLLVGKTAFEESPRQLQLGLAVRHYLSASLRFNGYKSDSLFHARGNGFLHLRCLHQPKIVTEHDRIDPVGLGRVQQVFSHILVRAESEELDLAGLFHF